MSNDQAILFRLTQLNGRLTRQLDEMGWNDAGIYDRDWKKRVAATKQEIKVLEAQLNVN